VTFYVSFLINFYTFALALEIESISRAWVHFGLIFTYQASHHFHLIFSHSIYLKFSYSIRSFSLFGLFLFTHQASTHERKKQFHFGSGSPFMAKLGLPFSFPIFTQIFFFLRSFPPTKPTTKMKLLLPPVGGGLVGEKEQTKQRE